MLRGQREANNNNITTKMMYERAAVQYLEPTIHRTRTQQHILAGTTIAWFGVFTLIDVEHRVTCAVRVQTCSVSPLEVFVKSWRRCLEPSGFPSWPPATVAEDVLVADPDVELRAGGRLGRW